jgi:galactokinase
LLDAEVIRQEFSERFGGDCRVFRAPGRVNLIGEHTDYNDGFVLPAAIDLYTWAAFSPDPRNVVRVHSYSLSEDAVLDLSNLAAAGSHHWSDYVRGVALELHRAGVQLRGGNLLINSDVPIGAGLSSSAAVEVASALALMSAAGAQMDPLDLARLCQRAENEFVGARCGIMDQFIACFGRQDHAVMLDCRSLDYQPVPLPPDLRLVICNTMVKHAIAAGEYNLRRTQCETAVRELARLRPEIVALRDATLDDLNRSGSELSDVIYRRCRHVITEDGRVIEAVKALEGGDLDRLRELLAASHRSLRDDYEVSCPELDSMVEIASNIDGVFGARMTGGGFGGCTINLVRSDVVSEFKRTVAALYESRWARKPDIFACAAASGAGEL